MKYDLQRLGPIGFQDLCAALAIRALGASLRPMGSGRDGGRDLMTTDPVRWSVDSVWTGTTVFQVKHQATAKGASDVATLARAIEKELEDWASPDSQRGQVPNQLVFVSNVFLSAVPGTGGFDALTNRITNWLGSLDDTRTEDALDGEAKKQARAERLARRDRMSHLRHWKILDGNHLVGLLDAHQDVRKAVDGFLQPGDILADLARFSGLLSASELPVALKEHARWALTNERKVYFNEAGADPKGFPLEDVVIDLPVRVSGTIEQQPVIRYVLDHGEHLLRPSLATRAKPRHIVIVGAPGNGKTTVSKFLVHAYRATWVGEDSDLGEEHSKTVKATHACIRDLRQQNPPAHRRWPMRVDLARFADRKATDPDYTLLTFMAETLTRQAPSHQVTKAVLAAWLREWPSVLVLDGLDEVTEPTVRKGLIADVEAFVDVAETDDCDMLVVATTRPTGYSDDLQGEVFHRLDLDDLNLADALRYGKMVTQIRVPDDSARRGGIVSALEAASRSENLQRLLRTPLQVLIMTIIAESAPQFSPNRYSLFYGYYQTIEQRERNKPTPDAALIRDNSALVLDLHRRAGLLLQERAETVTGADSVLDPGTLRDVAWQVLHDAGYKPSDADANLLDKVVTATTNRLVLLAPLPGGGFGFDVRSLQELMAALALTTGDLDEALPRLRRIGASPHWRNTFLFAVGRYFSEPQPHQKEAVTGLVLTIDQDAHERLGAIFPVSQQLAAEMIDDGMAAEPKYLHPLVEQALKALHYPESHPVTTYAQTLMAAAGASDAVRMLVADGLRAALSGPRVARRAAQQVIDTIGHLSDHDEIAPSVRALKAIKRDPKRTVATEPFADWDSFSQTLELFAEPQNEEVLKDIDGILRHVASSMTARPGWADDVQIYLSDPTIAQIVEAALEHVAGGTPLLVARLRHDVMPILWRQPVEQRPV